MDNYVETLKKVLTNPEGFFSEMPKEGGYGEPLKFATINFAIFGLLSGIVAVVMKGSSPTSIVSTLIGAVIGGIIGLFIFGIILFILFKIVGGSGSYEGTVRILSYTSATQILTWIPLIGILAALYSIWLNIVGGKHVHNISTVRSAIAVLIPVVIIVILVVVLAALITAFVLSMGGVL